MYTQEDEVSCDELLASLRAFLTFQQNYSGIDSCLQHSVFIFFHLSHQLCCGDSRKTLSLCGESSYMEATVAVLPNDVALLEQCILIK